VVARVYFVHRNGLQIFDFLVDPFYGDELSIGSFSRMGKKHLSAAATHTYILCGWRTQSEIPLTSVPTLVNDANNVDVAIHIATGRSPMAKRLGRFSFHHTTERSLIRIENVADFEIKTGRQIRVWPAKGAKQKDIEIFLFGPAWATLCHQRGTLPLHTSAIVSGTSITAFAGHSGVGKSTTAALLNSLGYRLAADDILPVTFNRNSVPGAWPYLRRLKLHREPITQLSFTSTEIVSEALDRERYFVYPKHAADDKWSKLDRIYLLEVDPTCPHVSIDRITGAEAVRTLIDQTYHFSFVLGSGQIRDHLARCAYLASQIAVYRLRRSPSIRAGIELGSIISAHLRENQPHNPIEPECD
jgi:hypothetical protein